MESAVPSSPESRSRLLTPVEAWRRYDADEQRLSAHVSERMLDLAGVRPGTRVLDIASGRGEPALRAAARVAPDGFVLGTDSSSDMLAFAKSQAGAERLTNLSFVVSDGTTLAGVPDQSFDVALCRWGFMFFDHPVDALKATCRCLKPGGTLVAALWAEPELVPWSSMPRRVLARHAPQPPVDPAAPGVFHYAETKTFRADLADAGFSFEHEEEHHTALMETATADGVIDWCLAFGFAQLLADQPEAVRTAWTNDMRAEAQAYREADGMFRLGGVTRLVVARATD
ncbi:MAG: methyltransferase domain-containing protein [Rhizobacter sp.]